MQFKPGIYKDLDIEDYHKSEGISSSGINVLLDCPAKFHYKYILGNNEKTTSEDHLIGSAVHTLLLEPHLFDKKFFITDKERLPGDAKGKAALIEQANGCQVLKKSQLEIVNSMVESAKNHPIWQTIENPRIEHSFFWYGGVFDTPLRARPDLYTDKIIIDIKTVKSIKNFSYSILDYGYHRQAAMQVDGINQLTGKLLDFGWFLIEKDPPYLTACYYPNFNDLEQGRLEYSEAACKYTECLLYNEWPGYAQDFQEIRLPKFARIGD